MTDINKQIIDAAVMGELGQTGLVRFSGFVFEEFLRELQGPRGMAVYREMRDNDATIGALNFAIDQLIRKVSWRVDAASDDPQDQQNADFVQGCMEDMTTTWTDLISEIMTMKDFGFSWHEVVYKMRLGQQPGMAGPGQDAKELPTSKYNDGAIGWRRIPIRAQETLWQWEFDEHGSIQAMIQRSPPNYDTVRLPIEKALLFRHRPYKNNPEGRSAYRNAYRSWYFKKKIEVIEAIGIERELNGLPVAEVPAELLATNATAEQKQILAIIKKLVTSIRMDEQGGVVWPNAYDKEGHKLFDLKLLSTGGRRAIDTDKIIQRYDKAIAQTILADFILIGHSGVGSYALAESKIDLFGQAIEGWLDSIAETFNRYAIPRLFKLNGWRTDNLPALAHGKVSEIDLKDLAEFITAVGAVKAITFGPRDEGFLRQVSGLPASEDGEANMEVGKAAGPLREMAEAARMLLEKLKELPDE